MSNIVNIALPSTGNKVFAVGNKNIESWRERSEREYLARSHPGPSAREKELEKELLRQVGGKPVETSVSPQLAAAWNELQSQYLKEKSIEQQINQQMGVTPYG